MSVAGPSCISSGSMITNYARMGHAAQQLFPEVLQDLIMIKEPQHRLHADVSSNRFLNKNLRADEWSMINNARSNGYVSFDIPLIYKLIRNLNLIPLPTQGWDYHTPPTSREATPGDDLERIRRTRNTILHRGNSNVTDLELTDFFCMSKDIASRLESYLGKPAGEYVSKFENLETCCMDETIEKLYIDRLEDLKKKDEDLARVVEEIKLEVDSLMNKDFHQIEIEEWEEENKLFIKTDAVDFVLTSLEKNNIFTVTGSSGVGKSATAHHSALFLRDTQGYYIFPCHTPSDIERYYRKNKKNGDCN